MRESRKKSRKKSRRKQGRRFFHILCLSLSIFLLAGCSFGEYGRVETSEGTNPDGGMWKRSDYIQQELPLPDEIQQASYVVVGFLQAEEPELFLWNPDRGAFEKYVLSPSSEWTAQPCEWLNSAVCSDRPKTVAVLYQDGAYYAKYGAADGGYHLVRSEDEKNAVEIPMEGWDKQVVDRIAVLSDNTVAATLTNRICQIYIDGKVAGEFDCGESYSLAGYGRYAAHLSEGNTEVCLSNTESMETEKKLRFANANEEIPQLFMKDETSVYLAGNTGLKELNVESGEERLLINGSQTMFSYGGYFPLWLEKTSEEEWYVLFVDRDQANARLMKYSKGTEEGDEQGKPLVIYSIKDNELIRSAISNFSMKYPSLDIQYEVAESENGAATDSDLIRTLNARIEAGNGPDVLVLDGMPVDSYIEKGILADLSGVLAQSDLAPNIRKAYERNGQIYAVPTRVGLPIIIATDDVIEKVNNLGELAAYADRAKLPYYVEGTVTYHTLIENFYPLYINSMIKESKVDPAQLQDFLLNLKRIADSVGAVEASDFDNSRPARWVGLKQASLGIAIVNGMLYDQAEELLSYAEQNGDYRTADHLFMPYGLIGIRAGSAQKELAEQFVMEALDLPVQQTEYLGAGFPVTNAALEKWKDTESVRGGQLLDPNIDVPIDFDWPDAGERERLFREIAEADTPILQDDIVREKLMTIGEQYLKGDITIEAAVQEITEEVEVYMQE